MKIFNDLQSLKMKDLLRSSKNFEKYQNLISTVLNHMIINRNTSLKKCRYCKPGTVAERKQTQEKEKDNSIIIFGSFVSAFIVGFPAAAKWVQPKKHYGTSQYPCLFYTCSHKMR